MAEVEKKASARATATQRKGHVLTADDRRRGAQAANRVRKERAKSVRERLAEAAEEHIERIVLAFVEAMEAEDEKGRSDHATRVRSAREFLEQAFGKPIEATLEVSGTATIQVEHRPLDVAQLVSMMREFGVFDEVIDGSTVEDAETVGSLPGAREVLSARSG